MNDVGVEVVEVGVDLAGDPDVYLARLRQAVRGRDVGMVFFNAGALSMGRFEEADEEELDGELELNVCSVARTFRELLPGLLSRPGSSRSAVVITGSQTGFWPSPFALTYGPGKAFLSSLASSLHAELAGTRVDLLSIEPAYVSGTALFDRVPDMAITRMLRAVSQTPEDVVEAIFASLGRLPIRETGVFTHFSSAVAAILGKNLVTMGMALAVTVLPDFKRWTRK